MRKLRLALILYCFFDYLVGYAGFIPIAEAQATTSTLASGGIGISCNAVATATSANPGTAAGCTSFALLTSGGSLPSTFTWQVSTTGSPGSVTVNLMGSLDNVTWVQADTISAAGTRTIGPVAYRFIGCVPATLSGGSSPTVTCQISPSGSALTGSGAGFIATTNGIIGLDTTANAVHLFVNSADSLAVAEAAGITANVVPKSTDATHGLITASSITDNGTTVSTTEAIATGSSGQFAVNASGLPTKTNNLTLAGQGYPVILGITSQKAETTTPDANVLTVTPASAVGEYEICTAISVSAATSGVIGWTATWKDSNANAQAPVELALFQTASGGVGGSASPALTFTTSAASNYQACANIDVDASGTAIVIKWIGGGTTTAKMSAWVKRVI